MWWSIGQINGAPLQHSTLHSSCQAVNACARHPYNPFSATLALYLFLTCPYSTTRTPVAPGCPVLPLHYLNREAKSMKNGLCGIHPSKAGMLSAAFIHLSDLLYLDPWHLLSHAIFISQSYAIRHREKSVANVPTTCKKNDFWSHLTNRESTKKRWNIPGSNAIEESSLQNAVKAALNVWQGWIYTHNSASYQQKHASIPSGAHALIPACAR